MRTRKTRTTRKKTKSRNGTYWVKWFCKVCHCCGTEEFPFKPHGIYVLRAVVEAHRDLSSDCRALSFMISEKKFHWDGPAIRLYLFTHLSIENFPIKLHYRPFIESFTRSQLKFFQKPAVSSNITIACSVSYIGKFSSDIFVFFFFIS